MAVTQRSAFTSELRMWLKKGLLDVLEELRDGYETFSESPENFLNLPDYPLKIKDKMCLIDMFKAAKESYCTIEEARMDITLLVANCYTYFGPDSDYGRSASEMLKTSRRLFAELQVKYEVQRLQMPEEAKQLEKTGEGRVKEHPYNRKSWYIEHGLNQNKTVEAAESVAETSNVTPATVKDSPASTTPPTPTVTSTPADRHVVHPAVSPHVTPPPKRQKTVGFKVPMVSVSIPDKLGYGALTNRMREQLKTDKEERASLARSPPDQKVAESMRLADDKWTVADIINTYIAKVDERDHLRDDEKESIKTVMQGVLDNFNRYATTSLLYPVERRVVERFELMYELPPDYVWAEYLGVRYLVRLLALLPSRLGVVAAAESGNMLRIVQGLIMYLDANWDQFQCS